MAFQRSRSLSYGKQGLPARRSCSACAALTSVQMILRISESIRSSSAGKLMGRWHGADRTARHSGTSGEGWSRARAQFPPRFACDTMVGAVRTGPPPAPPFDARCLTRSCAGPWLPASQL